MHAHPRRRFLLPALLLLAATPLPNVRASSVLPMTVRDMADHAAQVVVGRVAAVESHWAENPRRIESTITLEQVEFLKGAFAGAPATFSLVVPGGRIGTTQMRIGCAPQFEDGRQYLLFLLPRYKTHPVVGLWQGAFRITTDDAGVARVLDADGRPVTAIDAEGFVQAVGAPPRAPIAHLHAASHAIVLDPSARAAAPDAMTLTEFVDHLRPVLAASRDHHLTVPAGQRDTVTHTPTALQRSPRDAARSSAGPPPPRSLDAHQAVHESHTTRTAAQEAQR